MDVILNQDVKSLGKKGEKVSVKDGYARNYLFPRGLASESSAQSLTELKNRENAKEYKIKTDTENALRASKALSGNVIKISAKAGSSGRLFGSITAKEVAEEISRQIGIEVDKRKVKIEDIKQYGTYDCEVKLYQGVSAKLKITVGE